MDRRPHRGQAGGRGRPDAVAAGPASPPRARPGPLRARRGALRRRLLAWYRANARDLPWRRTADAYRIWLSETMLQQTRVETVIPYYERFLARFPTLDALAAADEEDVLALWSGLGYYARARNLHRAAASVVREHGGRVPRDPTALAELPGVGRYTAGALRSIAFAEPAALVDGNVRRVLARWCADAALSDAAAWALAEDLVPEAAPGDWNQALMELGATVCTPRAPDCPACPVAALCDARASGRPEAFPAPKQRAATRAVRAVGGVLLRRGRVLLVRRPSHGLLGGLWELPNAEDAPADALPELVRARTGIRAALGPPLGELRHVFTHRTLRLELFALADRGGRVPAASRATARFCAPAELDGLALSRLMKRALALPRPS